MNCPQFTTEELAQEEWRNVIGYEGYYSVSSLGRVRRDALPSKNRRGLSYPGKILAGGRSGGYRTAKLCMHGKEQTYLIHRLVALAFLEGSGGPVVNHKDGDKWNNHPSNLEWVTTAENNKHAARIGLTARDERHWKCKLTAAQVIEIRERHAAAKESKKALASEYGVSLTHIYRVINREVRDHL